MALLILSEVIPDLNDTLDVINKVARICDFHSSVEPYSNSKNQGQEVYMAKKYKDQDAWMYLGIDAVEEVARFSEIADLRFNGRKYYRLGVSDQAKYDRLIYDFALNYLKRRPDHVICLYGSDFFTLAHLESLERSGGYRQHWCYPES